MTAGRRGKSQPSGSEEPNEDRAKSDRRRLEEDETSGAMCAVRGSSEEKKSVHASPLEEERPTQRCRTDDPSERECHGRRLVRGRRPGSAGA